MEESLYFLTMYFFLVKFLFLELRIFSAYRVSYVWKLNVFYVAEFYYETVKPLNLKKSWYSYRFFLLYFPVPENQQMLKAVVSFYYTHQITPTCFGS
jgi:hypothetical protein